MAYKLCLMVLVFISTFSLSFTAMLYISAISDNETESTTDTFGDTTYNTINNDGRVMLCYYGSWAVYRPEAGKFDVEDIDPEICTHLIYGFAGLNPTTNEIISLDPWNDLYDNYGKGAYLRFTRLKKANPELKTLLAIGGWNEGSVKYSKMAETPYSRKVFISSCVAFLHKYGFDGLDIDWEYPTLRGGRPQDKVNFALLLDEMRLEFNNNNLLMTSAVSAGKVTIDSAYDVESMVRNLDFIQLMAYDLHGTWEPYAHHHSPLYAYERDTGANSLLNVDWAVNYWLKLGVPPSKLVLGIGLYGRCFTLASADQHTVYSAAPQPGIPGPYTREPGVLGYNEICEQQAYQSILRTSGTNTSTNETRYVNSKIEERNGKRMVLNNMDVEREEKYTVSDDGTVLNISERKKRGVFFVEIKDTFKIDSQLGSRETAVINDISHVYEYTDDNGERKELKYTNKEMEELTTNKKVLYAINNDRNEAITLKGDIGVRIVNTNTYLNTGEDIDQNQELEEENHENNTKENSNIKKGGWTIVRDKNMISPYAYKDRQWCGYDDVESAAIKAEYIIKRGLAGAMVWSIDTDDFHGKCNRTQHFPLITTIRTILRDGKPIPTATPITTTITTANPNTTTTSESTSTTTIHPTTPSPTTICHREGLNADPDGDCTLFYNCHAVDGNWTVYLFHCAPGTIFVESLQACDFPDGHSLRCNILPP